MDEKAAGAADTMMIVRVHGAQRERCGVGSYP